MIIPLDAMVKNRGDPEMADLIFGGSTEKGMMAPEELRTSMVMTEFVVAKIRNEDLEPPFQDLNDIFFWKFELFNYFNTSYLIV